MSGAHLGTHLIVDAWGSSPEILDDPDLLRQAVIDAAVAGAGTLLEIYVHKFDPHGVTVNATLAESHIAMHTWPERRFYAADLFFCGNGDPHRALDRLRQATQPVRVRLSTIERGAGEAEFSTHTGRVAV